MDVICGELNIFLRYEFIVRILYRCALPWIEYMQFATSDC